MEKMPSIDEVGREWKIFGSKERRKGGRRENGAEEEEEAKKRDFSFLFLLGKRQTVGRQLHYSSFGSPGSEKKEEEEEDELGVNYV